ncbi:hypothetical protein D5S17_35580 [Pseudonocardiaceae bacterium YIM PH 21723]|nr:hypothetical protein D5S17_35580 [Pseudonocardiaceae bacterium YIM PH 21723]
MAAAVMLASAITATTVVGGLHRSVGVPAILTYSIPVVLYAVIAASTVLRARSGDPRLRRATRESTIAVAVIVAIAAALCIQIPVGHFDSDTLLGMAVAGVACGAGPFLLAVVFLPKSH